MKVYHQPVELIVGTSGVSMKGKSSGSWKKVLEEAGIPVRSITGQKTKIKKGIGKKGPVGQLKDTLYIKTDIKDSEVNPWDVAHISGKALGAQTSYLEPDLLQEFVVDRNADASYKKSKKSAKGHADDLSYDPDWQPHKNIIWHLGDSYSQLKSARESVENIDYEIRIGHLDTGYSPTHKIISDRIRNNPLQRNFIEGEKLRDAHDPLTNGMLRMPGHGTGTAGILAGAKIRMDTDNGVFNDYLGGAWFADVICCRVATSVVLMKTSAFADAINYLVQLSRSGTPIHVVSMSMGGAPAKAWADAVNKAYDAGITLVTAAGNNFNKLPTQHVVCPARFKRVIAACGVTYDLKPYSSSKLGEMQGCYGPDRHMTKALAAFTPNTPWAKAESGKISFAGAGTSSATPQIAAAAALYYRKYHEVLDALEPWQRVEAIRNALFNSALKKVNGKGSYVSYFGNGIVQAMDALKIKVKAGKKTPEDSIPWFPILSTIFKAKPGQPGKTTQMFNTELAQLVYYYPELSNIIDDEKNDYDKVIAKKWKKFTDAVIAHPGTSITLKKFLMQTHSPKK